MIRQAVRHAVLYGLSSAVSRGMFVLQVPLFSYVLKPHDFAVLDILTITMSLVNLTVAFEIAQAVAVYYSTAQADDDRVAYVSTAFWFTLFVYGTFVIFAFVYAGAVASWLVGSAEHEILVQLCAVTALSQGVYILTRNQLRWMLRVKDYVVVDITVGVTNLSLSVVLVLGFGWGVDGILVGQLAGCCLGFLWAIKLGRTVYVGIVDFAKLKEMLHFSLPLVPSSVSVFLALFVDRFVIKELLGMADVGLYGVAYRIAAVMGALILGVNSSLTPLIYNKYQEERTAQDVSQLVRYFLMIALGCILILGFFSQEILQVCSGSEYHSVHTLIPILAASLFASNLYVFAPGLILQKRTRVIALISFITALMNLVLNLTLVPLIGIAGAAWGTCLSAIGGFVLWWGLAQVSYAIPVRWIGIAPAVLVVMAAVVMAQNFLHSANLWVAVVMKICVLVPTMGIVVLQLVQREEIAAAMKRLKQKGLWLSSLGWLLRHES